MNNTSTPYRDKDMLTEANFLRFCKKNGLEIDGEYLRLLEEENLVQPAYIPPDHEAYGAGYYSPYQMYTYRKLKGSIRWIEAKKVDLAMERNAISQWNKLYEFLTALDDLYEDFGASYYRLRHKSYVQWLKTNYGLTPTQLGKSKIVGKKRSILKQELVDMKSSYRDAYDEVVLKFVPKARRLTESYGYAMNDIIGLSRDFMNEGSLARNYTSLDQRLDYARSVDIEALIKHEHPYQTSSHLLWLYSLLGDGSQQVTFAGELIGNQGTRCIYCGKAYSKRQYNQRTCGSDDCRKADAQAIKRQKRSAGLYAWH